MRSAEEAGPRPPLTLGFPASSWRVGLWAPSRPPRSEGGGDGARLSRFATGLGDHGISWTRTGGWGEPLHRGCVGGGRRLPGAQLWKAALSPCSSTSSALQDTHVASSVAFRSVGFCPGPAGMANTPFPRRNPEA